MKTSTLIVLSRRLDKTLTHFALAANAGGQYPWEVAQQQKRLRQQAGMAAGVAAIGAGAYGAKKGHEAIMKRGLPMAQAAAGGPVRTRDAYKAVAGEGMDKLKGYAAPVIDPLKRKLGAVKNAGYAYRGARQGVMGKGGMGVKGALMKVARGIIHASRADVLVELEAQLDGALQEFGNSNLLVNLPEDWERHGEGTVRQNPKTGEIEITNKDYSKPRKISGKEAMALKSHKDGKGFTGYDDRSPSRIRRAKAVGGMVATGAAGYLAGKHGGKVLSRAKAMIKRSAA